MKTNNQEPILEEISTLANAHKAIERQANELENQISSLEHDIKNLRAKMDEIYQDWLALQDK